MNYYLSVLDELNKLMVNPKKIICDTNFTDTLVNSTEDKENLNEALEGICKWENLTFKLFIIDLILQVSPWLIG